MALLKNMIAIPEGSFTIGSPESEPFRSDDESPQQEIRLSGYWMGEIEVTWREFEAYYSETATMAKDDEGIPEYEELGVDAVTGPTPPYGAPDQGWGRRSRPAITMTHHTSMKYCEWLSEKTGKKYRLPTEAEWEYDCRAGTTDPYFFEGSPKKLTEKSWLNRLLGVDNSIIAKHVYYMGNSGTKTQLPYTNEPNQWGLYNMLGNVREMCLDWYAGDAYSGYASGVTIENPRGPQSGEEHVVRGGAFDSDPADLRSSTRDRTEHDTWMITDPQSPKSLWWYSDVKNVGFRIVRELD